MNQSLHLPADLAFYITPPHPCSYLPEREAITLFADPHAELSTELYSRLASHGFRRSGNHVYRPHCGGCRACLPVRIPVDTFAPTRSQRRCQSANDGFEVTIREQRQINPEQFDLYRRYLQRRHPDSTMTTDEPLQVDNFLTSSWSKTRFVEFRENGQLLIVAVVDWLSDGLSAVYTFFEPAAAQRGLGTAAILWQIEQSRREGLPYLYLGYLIEAAPQMAYKSRYHPLEAFRDGRWLPYQPANR